MKTLEIIAEADLTRRQMLGKMAAGAAAAATGSAMAGQALPTISPEEADQQLKELKSKAYKDLANMVWMAWPWVIDQNFGAQSGEDKPATIEDVARILGPKLVAYAKQYRELVHGIKIAAGIKDPAVLNKTMRAP